MSEKRERKQIRTYEKEKEKLTRTHYYSDHEQLAEKKNYC